MERTSGWVDAGQGFEGIESRLKLKAWRRERRFTTKDIVRGESF